MTLFENAPIWDSVISNSRHAVSVLTKGDTVREVSGCLMMSSATRLDLARRRHKAGKIGAHMHVVALVANISAYATLSYS